MMLARQLPPMRQCAERRNPTGRVSLSTRLLLALITFFVQAGVSRAATVAYYRFENGTAGAAATAAGSIIDSTGVAANNGTPSGSPVYSSSVPVSPIPATGAADAVSLQFSGSQVVTFNYQFPLNTLTNATLEFWLNPPTNASEQDIFWTRTDSTDANRFNLGYTSGGVLFLDYRDPSGALHSLLAFSVSPAVWTHVAFVKAGNTWTAYKNGVLQSTFTDSSPSLPTNTGWTISGRGAPFTYFGLLDEIRISDAALAPSQFLNQLPPAIISSVCSSSNPAPISGSTGAQGVLDPANADPTLGLVWPAGTVNALIAMATGGIQFFGPSGLLGSATVPGAIDANPAFPNGEMNFTAVHIPVGITLSFSPAVTSGPLPIVMLSCQDIIIDGDGTTNSATNGTIAGGTNIFPGGIGSLTAATATAGFGARAGAYPAAGSLYPAVGGAGGNGGALAGGTSPGLQGGNGGAALVLVAAGRVTMNGIINTSGSGAAPGAGNPPGQGGAGGSVRLAGLLTEGVGNILTGGGANSSGGITSPAGPIEIQAFLADGDLFTSPCGLPQCSTTAIRGNAPVQPIPDNLPTITVTQLNNSSTSSNKGSLISPDVTLPTPTTSQLDVTVQMSTQGVPDGTMLTVHAVGTDGSAATATATVSTGMASADLTLNAGTTYQIVVIPTAPLYLTGTTVTVLATVNRGTLANWNPGIVRESLSDGREAATADQWMKAFAVRRELAAIAPEHTTAQLTATR